jgi:regulatory protein
MFHRPKENKDRLRVDLTVSDMSAESKSENKTPSEQISQSRTLPDLSEKEIGKALKKRRKDKTSKKVDPGAGKKMRNEKPMTESRIRNITEYYLSQRDASTDMLRQMLVRRAYAWLKSLNEEERYKQEAEFKANVENRIAELVDNGLVCDKRYALQKVRSMRASGKGARRIQLDLSKKGLTAELIQDAISEVDAETVSIDDRDISAEESDRAAAENLARKKRIGPYRLKPTPQDHAEKTKLWRREAGVLSRAGYGLDIIRDILDREPEEDDWGVS